MCDASGVPCHTFHATPEYDDPPHGISRPKTPLPNDSRALRRTISYASVDTIHPPSSKSVCQRITEIAENLKHKSAKKNKKQPSMHDVLKRTTRDPASDSKAPLASKATLRGRKATPPLRDSSHRSEEESVLAIADRLHSGVPWESPLTTTSCFNPPVNILLAKGEQLSEGGDFSTGSHKLEVGVAAGHQDAFKPLQTSKAGIKDVQLDIQPSESDVAIWDGLQVAYHPFRCRLYLRCTTHPYDTVSLPDIPRVEMNCHTHPVGSRYTGPPVLQAAYTGASPCEVTSPNGLPEVNLARSIHIDRFWRTTLDDDSTWGWYRDVLVPLSSRLFDKIEYRQFKLVSRVWVGESCVEDELTFGISMLLRELDMK